MSSLRLDLGPGDVHRDGAARPGGNEDPGTWVDTKTTRARETAEAWQRHASLGCADGAELGALPLPEGFDHEALTVPRLTGTYSGPPYQDGWVGWCEDAARSWILFLDVSGVGLLWTKRDEDGGIVGDPYRVDRPELLPTAAPMRAADLGTRTKMRSRPTPAETKKKRATLDRAKKRKAPPGPKRGASIQGTGFRVSVSSHPGGTRRVEVVHSASDDAGVGFGEGLPVELAEVFAKLADAERRAKALPEGDERAALEGEVRKLLDEAAVPRWNQIAKVGDFNGHPAGPFKLNPSVFDEIVRNFKNVDGSRVPIDFEHASEADESSGNIPVTGAPAQGWVTDLQNRGMDGLYGLTSFLEPALSYVREGRYRSFSPAIRFGAKHPESGLPIGARLTSVALVTRPFLRNLKPLAARDESAPPTGERPMSTNATKLDDKHPHEMMKSLKATMGLHNLSTADDMRAHLDKLRDHAAAVLDKPHGHAMGHVSAGGVNCGEYTAPMAAALGAPATMTTSELLDAVEELIDAAMNIHEATEHHMSDQDTTANIIKLSERLGTAEEKIRLLTGEKATALRDVERLTLEVKAKDAKIVELETAATAAATDLKTLRDAEAKREDAAVNERVDAAFNTYKDSHKLSDSHRPMMVRELRADRANFEKLYPLVGANQQHLLRNLAGERTPTGSTTTLGDRAPVTAPGPTAPGGGARVEPSMTAETQRLLADRLVKERHMTREAATSLAYRVASGAAEMPVFTN